MAGNNHGVGVTDGALVIGGTTGIVTVRGAGGLGGTDRNHGVLISGNGSTIASDGGKVELTGTAGVGASSFGIQVESDGLVMSTGGSSTVTFTADSMTLTSATSINAGAHPVILRPRTPGSQIDLGGDDVLSGSSLTLGLTNAELDRVTAGALTIGDSASGKITVSAPITRSTSTNMKLISGDAIVFDSGS